MYIHSDIYMYTRERIVDYNKHLETVKYVQSMVAHINPHTDKRLAHVYAVGFLSSVIAAMIDADSANYSKFKLACAAKWKNQQ